VLARHATRPTVSLGDLLGSDLRPKASPPATASPRDDGPALRFADHADPSAVTPYTTGVLQEILRAAGLKDALVSSTARSPAEQARVMYDNCERYGADAQKTLYASAGDKVIDVYAASKAAGRTPDQIKADMETKIKEIGPTSVSRHASDPRVLNVLDVAPSSIRDKVGFEHSVKADHRVSFFLTPPVDPGYHLEIPQPR
jgi:hypothetical protein